MNCVCIRGQCSSIQSFMKAVHEYAELPSTREIRFSWIFSNHSQSVSRNRKISARLGALIDFQLPGIPNNMQIVLDTDEMDGEKLDATKLAAFVAEHPQKLTFSVDAIECTANLTAAGAAQTISGSRFRRLTSESLSLFLRLEEPGKV